MRTTVDLDEKLVKEALAVTKITTKTALLEEGLRALLRREASRALAAMGGSQPQLKPIPRRRYK